MLPPIKKKATPRSPPREKSKASLVGAGKSGKTVGGFASLADVEAERLDIIRRKVLLRSTAGMMRPTVCGIIGHHVLKDRGRRSVL